MREGAHTGQPTDPPDANPTPPPEGGSGEDANPAGLGDHGGEFGHCDGAHQGVQAANRPSGYDECAISKRRGHCAGQAEYADADCCAQDERQTEPKAENSPQGARSCKCHCCPCLLCPLRGCPCEGVPARAVRYDGPLSDGYVGESHLPFKNRFWCIGGNLAFFYLGEAMRRTPRWTLSC